MNNQGRLLVLIVFSAIAITLVVYGWVPARSSLQQDQARIVAIMPHPGTRYNAIFVTGDGRRLTCIENTLREWPPALLNRCPVDTFAAHLGEPVTVLHDGHVVYAVRRGQQVLLPYSAFRWVQGVLLIVALIMVAVSVHYWIRNRP